MTDSFSHLNQNADPHMVSVGEKDPSKRIATAQALVHLPEIVMQHFTDSELVTKKGPVFQTAILAGIMGAKKTGDLIPLCHPIGMDHCNIQIKVIDNHLRIVCTAEVFAKTGVEMEALTGASIAALTVYDMCKSFGHEILIKEIKLLEKRGGKRDFIGRENE